MTEQKLTELLRHAYHWGRDNGSNRSEKNFNDFLQTKTVQKALSIANVVGQSEQFYCVSSDALVYGKPCKKWCGDEHCKALCKQ